ncbi:DUF2963 domain-containing protein [Candidatus Phytoplasma tritici]|uniref:DUF2963 domain-containing protein n=1 Tax=Candidatus Phytoplasma tritici TaxID=321961 RepID=UPI000463157B|nr:DUF2963 domain-containing protein [Candidatus Phytoplasma tritici]
MDGKIINYIEEYNSRDKIIKETYYNFDGTIIDIKLIHIIYKPRKIILIIWVIFEIIKELNILNNFIERNN